MKKNKKILCLIAVVFLLAAGPAFSEIPSFEDLQGTVSGFAESLAQSLPFNSTIGLNWSDAYIGQLLGFPPRLGVGFSLGATTMPIDSLTELAGNFGFNIPFDLAIGLPLPAYTIEGRVGGIILPFDVGFKFGYIPEFEMFGLGLNYRLIGFDIRYALINTKILPIKLSVGLGYNNLEGGFSATLPTGLDISFDDLFSLSVSPPEFNLFWKTNVVELKAHVSFPLFIVTPYAGAGFSWAWSSAGYKLASEITTNGISLEDAREILEELGVSNLDTDGFESTVDVNGWNMRLYAGLSFNITFIRLDFTLMYNVRDAGLGFTFGTRFQL